MVATTLNIKIRSTFVGNEKYEKYPIIKAGDWIKYSSI